MRSFLLGWFIINIAIQRRDFWSTSKIDDDHDDDDLDCHEWYREKNEDCLNDIKLSSSAPLLIIVYLNKFFAIQGFESLKFDQFDIDDTYTQIQNKGTICKYMIYLINIISNNIWFTIMRVFAVFVLEFEIYFSFLAFTKEPTDLQKYLNIYEYVVFPITAILILFVFASLWRYFEMLLEHDWSDTFIMDPDVIKTQRRLRVNKLWTVRIYFVLVMVISITLITSGITGYGVLAMDCSVFSLVTMMMYFGTPLTYKFEQCPNCRAHTYEFNKEIDRLTGIKSDDNMGDVESGNTNSNPTLFEKYQEFFLGYDDRTTSMENRSDGVLTRNRQTLSSSQIKLW